MTDNCLDMILINDLRNIGLTQQWYFILSLTVIVLQSTFISLFVHGSLFTLLFGDILVNLGDIHSLFKCELLLQLYKNCGNFIMFLIIQIAK